MKKLSLLKSMNNPKHMKSINSLSLVKTIIEHVMCTRVLRRPIVFLRVRFSVLSLWHLWFSLPHCTVMIGLSQ